MLQVKMLIGAMLHLHTGGNVTGDNSPGGGGLPYERDRDARRLA